MRFVLRSLLVWLLALPAFAATVSDVTESTTTGSTTLSVSRSASTVSGDFQLMCIYQAAVGTSGPTMTTPSGWTLIRRTAPSFAGSLTSFYRVATGAETSAVSVTSDDNGRAVHQVLRIDGADGLDASSENNQVFATSHASASVTTGADGELVVLCLGVDAPDNPLTVTIPSGTTAGDAATNNPTTAAMASAYFTQVTAGSTGTQTWTSLADSDQTMSQTIALTEAAGGGGATLPITLQQLDKAYGPQRSQQLGGLLQ